MEEGSEDPWGIEEEELAHKGDTMANLTVRRPRKSRWDRDEEKRVSTCVTLSDPQGIFLFVILK